MISNKDKVKEQVEGIAKALKTSPNGHIRLKYAFYTWIVILNGYLPQDTVDIYKQDDNLRIDCIFHFSILLFLVTIDGIEGISITRGHISILFIGNSDNESVESQLFQINHKKKTYEPISFSMSKNDSEGEINDELIDMKLKAPRFYVFLLFNIILN